MRCSRIGLTVGAVLAAVLLVPTTAWAGDVQREEFGDSVLDPWQVIGFGDGGASAKVRYGALTVGRETLVMLREEGPPTPWVGSANRLSGFDVDFRMRLGAEDTGSCTDATPPSLLWLGDTTDLLQIGFAPGELCVLHPEQLRVELDTQRWHRYHLEARGQHLRLLVDGRVLLDQTLTRAGSGTIGLGLETFRGTATWDYVRYDTAPGRACTIRGTDGPDVLVGTPRADVICAGAGDDHVSGLGGDDVLIGGEGGDTLLGGDGHDLLQGDWGDDVLDNGADSGRAEGGQGDDRFVTSALPDGAHQLVGGPGHDVADYSARTGPVTVSLDALGGDGAPGEGDAVGVPAPWNWFTDVEEVRGGLGDDVLTGDRWPDVLVGGPGADVLRGADGTDTLDAVDAVEGNDSLDGGDGTDTCTADPQDAMTSCNDPDPWPTMPPPPSPSAGATVRSLPATPWTLVTR